MGMQATKGLLRLAVGVPEVNSSVAINLSLWSDSLKSLCMQLQPDVSN